MSVLLAFLFAFGFTAFFAWSTWGWYNRHYKPWWSVALFGFWTVLSLVLGILTNHWYNWVEFMFFGFFLTLGIYNWRKSKGS